MSKELASASDKKQKPEKFNYETMRQAATHQDVAVRKMAFIEYFERFAEFPSYLFDNERSMDTQLGDTIDAILADEETTKEVRKGIEALLHRLPSR